MHYSPSGDTSKERRIRVLPSGGNPTLVADMLLHEAVRMHIKTHIEASKLSTKRKCGQNWLYELSLMDSCD